jgi:hypothetical protein
MVQAQTIYEKEENFLDFVSGFVICSASLPFPICAVNAKLPMLPLLSPGGLCSLFYPSPNSVADVQTGYRIWQNDLKGGNVGTPRGVSGYTRARNEHTHSQERCLESLAASAPLLGRG